MGLKSFIKKRIEGSPEQKFQNQRKKAENIEWKQQLHEAKEKGYRTAALKHAEREGAKRGGGEGGGFTAKFGSNLNALGGAINNTERVFGLSGDLGNIGMGLDFGLGGSGGSSSKPKPTSETRVTKSGTVRIINYGNPNSKKKEHRASPYNWMNDIEENNFLE